MKDFIFLESCDFSIKLTEKNIISLNPSVSCHLDKLNLRYKILEDYYSEKELRVSERDYFFSQIKWFKQFDNFLREHISICNEFDIHLSSANYVRLKYFVDTVVIYARIILLFIEQEKHEIRSILHISEPPPCNKAASSIFDFKKRHKEVFGALLELFCKDRGISFKKKIVKNEKALFLESKFWPNSVYFYIKPVLKNVYNFFKYKKILKLVVRRKIFKNMNVLLMHAGSIDIDYPIKEFVKRGANVYLQENGRVVDENHYIRRYVNILYSCNKYLENIGDECKKCAALLKNEKNIVSWINDMCSINVFSVTGLFLENFISQDCNSILRDVARMIELYKTGNINYVFARGNTDKKSAASLIAVQCVKGVKGICVQHSNFILNNELLAMMEMDGYDCVLTRNNITEDFYKNFLKEIYRCNCKVYQSPYYLGSIKREVFKRNKNKRRKKTVIYVNKKFADGIRCFNNMIYPLNWYYKFQKRVIDFFCDEANFDFIYKHAPGQDWEKDSILEYISDRNCQNISICDRPFLKTLKYADRIIVDYPSGALFEAANAGKAVICVCADYFNIIKQAEAVFGKSLQTFSKIEGAISTIKEFLYANPDDYMVEIPSSDEDFISVFNQLVK